MEVWWAFFWVLAVLLIYIFLLWRIKNKERFQYYRIPCHVQQLMLFSQPDESNIYNISSRVQGSTHQYPDAYVSVDHIAITNELNKPPKYDDAPPSYEEAIKLATAHSNSIQTFQAEEATRQNQPHTSTATTSVVPAIHSRTTE